VHLRGKKGPKEGGEETNFPFFLDIKRKKKSASKLDYSNSKKTTRGVYRVLVDERRRFMG